MRLILYIFLLTSILVSCKKNENTSPITLAPASTSSAGTHGDFQTGYYIYDSGGIITNDSMVIATVFSAPASSSPPTNIYAGNVSLNGTTLKYNTLSNYYIDSTHNINMRQINWNVTGSGTVTAFSYSYTPIYPKCTSPISLSDTCIKANGITISLSGIYNISTNVQVGLYQGSNSLTKYISGLSGSVNFSATDLSSFVTNSPLTINLFFVNSTIVDIGSVKYGFTNTLTYNKFSYLK